MPQGWGAGPKGAARPRTRFEVDHTTRFTYSEPATLGPHTIRLRPRCDAAQEVRDWCLDIDPAPSGRFDFTDQDGNAVTRVWWNGTVRSLSVRTTFTVETLRSNPFEFFVFDPEARQVPPRYHAAERRALGAYLGPASPAAAAFARDVLAEGVSEVSPFLWALAARVRERVEHEVREEGEPQPPEVTLARGRGACRDTAVLFVEACRAVGIAGRFVSGYQDSTGTDGDAASGDGAPGEPPEQSLHAWAEAYVPGAGWRGFDPSQGLAVADRHVVVAAAASPGDAAPTEGSFGPARVQARLEAVIEVRVEPAP